MKLTAKLNFKTITASRGFSLVEAMATVAVLGVTALGAATLVSDMARQNANSKRSIARSNFEQRVVSLYRNTALCSCNLNNGTGLLVPDTGSVDILALKASCAGTTNDVYEYAAGGHLVGPDLIVTKMSVSNPQVITGDSFSAELTITYDSTRTALKPGKFLVLFEKTAAAGPPYEVSTCTIGGAISGGTGAGWLLTGNAGTDGVNDFVGTSDDNDVMLKRNDIIAGRLMVDGTGLGSGSLASLTTTSGGTVAVGNSALTATTTGHSNTVVGTSAMVTNTTGGSNNALGYQSLFNNTTGSSNAALGAESMYRGNTASNNTAVGYQSLYNNRTMAGNTAIGAQAILNLGSNFQNTAAGARALAGPVVPPIAFGTHIVAIGADALTANGMGNGTAVGKSALYSQSSGDNTAIGFEALYTADNALGNVAIGRQVLRATTTGYGNVAVGDLAMAANTTGNYNTAAGNSALASNTTGFDNTAIGSRTLFSNTTGTQNTIVGTRAGESITGNENTCAGMSCMSDLSTSSGNTGIGTGAAGSANINSSVAIGSYALADATGDSNTAIGSQTMRLATGSENVVIGNSILSSANGSRNTVIGNSSLAACTTCDDNTSFGNNALESVTTGAFNVAMGHSTLRYSTTGSYNIGIGYQAGGTVSPARNETGSYNIFIGQAARPASTGLTNAIAIGRNAVVGASNTLVFGGTGADAVNVGIGLTAPTYQLELSTDSAAKPGTATWTVTSDARLKDVRAPFTRGLSDLEKLSPVYYHYKEGNVLGLPSRPEFVGVIAQDVEKAVPEAVKRDAKGYRRVQTDSIIWTMLNAIKELFERVVADLVELRAELSSLEHEQNNVATELVQLRSDQQRQTSEIAQNKAAMEKFAATVRNK